MRTLHLLMPMAGEGSRFLKEGWTTPKPLIDLHGIPLFKRAIESVTVAGVSMKYSFIVRKEHMVTYHIDKLIKSFYPESNVFFVERTTRGAVETCLKAECAISPDEAIMVMDCDLEFYSKNFKEEIIRILNTPASASNGGVLVSFNSKEPRYSYAEIDDKMNVLRTAEKEVISNHALCGAYFFSSASGFLRAAHQLLDEPVFTKPEYYVSLLYNYLLADGETVKLCTVEKYNSYGTPEELKRYL